MLHHSRWGTGLGRDGEVTFLFKIMGGTDDLNGASGYIVAAGTAEVPGAVATNLHYTGKLTLP